MSVVLRKIGKVPIGKLLLEKEQNTLDSNATNIDVDLLIIPTEDMQKK